MLLEHIVIPQALAKMTDGYVSSIRIEQFLQLPEINRTHHIQTKKRSSKETASQASIKVTNAYFTWLPSTTKDINNAKAEVTNHHILDTKNGLLEDINLSVDAGDSPLVLIFGCTGSYKSSLLQAILGEMPRVRGGVECVGSVAYVQQVPFIMTGTVRDNILFGEKFDQERYDETLSACCLLEDLLQLPAGEHTMIGERGINLSGGQKMRVGLARAVYADADIYLIDDALAAVDVHVGEHLFHDVLIGMLSNKIRLVVMNQISYAKFADKIVLMGGSNAEEASTPALNKGPKCQTRSGWMEEIGAYHQLMLSDSSRLPGMLEAYQSNSASKQQISSPEANSLKQMDNQQTSKHAPAIASSKKKENSQVGRTLHTKEDRKRGRVKLGVFCRYAKAMGVWLWVLVVMLYLISESMRVFVDFIIAEWSTETQAHHQAVHNLTPTGQGTLLSHVFGPMQTNYFRNNNITTSIANEAHANNTATFTTAYIGLTAAAVIASAVRTLLLVLASIRAARILYV